MATPETTTLRKNLALRWTLVLTMCGLQFADILSTLRAIQHGAVEMNPLLIVAGQFNVVRLLAFKIIALTICCFLVLRTSKVRPELQMRRCCLYAVFFAVIVWSNSLL